jgi:hypothetical protein
MSKEPARNGVISYAAGRRKLPATLAGQHRTEEGKSRKWAQPRQ